MRPNAVVQPWMEAFNVGDADRLAEFYTDGAVNHQVANDPVEGHEAIRAMFQQEFAAAQRAKMAMVCIVENLFEDGQWAIPEWRDPKNEWRDPKNVRGCGFFQVQGGKIVFQRGYWDKLSFMKVYGLGFDG